MGVLMQVGKGENDKRPLLGFADGHLEGTIEMVTLNVYPRMKYEYTKTSMPIYIGHNRDASATATDADWDIIKYAYSADTVTAMPVDVQVLRGAWSGRAALGWDI